MSSTGGIVKEFVHHPMAGAKTENTGTFAGETKMDAWLFKKSNFLRTHFKHEEHFEAGESNRFGHESFRALGHQRERDSADTTRNVGSTAMGQEGVDEFDNWNVKEDAKWHEKTRRRSSLQKGADGGMPSPNPALVNASKLDDVMSYRILHMKVVRLTSVARWQWLCPPKSRRTPNIRQLKTKILSPGGHPSFTCGRTSPAEWTRKKDQTHIPDTIYALSTAPGRAAIAVIRISGPACLDIYGAFCPNKAFPHARTATLRKIYDPTDAQTQARVLDPAALVLYFPAPRTVTGEDVLELHVHGGTAIVRSILEAIPRCTESSESRSRRRSDHYSDIRTAEPGEFTKRAFYNGRLDLVQAEALGESLSAETEMQRRLAVDGQGGELGRRYEEWRSMLLYARGELEALIDFSEDQHFDESPWEFVRSIERQVLTLKRQIELHVTNARKGELLRDGVTVALLGAPNAGKSSLLNLVVGREAAIVSAEAGTTRDIVDVSVDLNGWLVRFGDMAGLRSGTASVDKIGLIEQEGIRRARARALESDVVIVLLPVQDIRHTPSVISTALHIDPELVDAVRECRRREKVVVFLLNKIDLLGPDPTPTLQHLKLDVQKHFSALASEKILAVSCKQAGTATDQESYFGDRNLDSGGVQAFLQNLTKVFEEITAVSVGSDSQPNNSTAGIPLEQAYWSASLSVSHRQSTYLQECLAHLNAFLEQCQPPSALPPPDYARVNCTHDEPLSTSHHIDGHEDIVSEISLDTDLDHHDQIMLSSNADVEVDIVTAAENLRAAATCLAKITGRGEGGDVEDVLGVVFEK